MTRPLHGPWTLPRERCLHERDAMTRTVLITGAGGFVGSALAEAELAAGHAVLATDMAFDSDTRARLGAAQLIEAPLPEALAGMSGKRVDAVIHAAAITADPARFGLTNAAHLGANLSLLLAALEWARDHGAGRFLFLSSSGVFGVANDAQAVDELTPATASDPYSAAKRAGEIILRAATEPGFEAVTLRLGPIFGPHEATRPTRPTPSLVARMMAAARERGEITVAASDARRDWTYLPDIARATGLLLDHSGALPLLLHLTSGRAVSDLELAQAVAAYMPGVQVRVAPETPMHPARPVMISTVSSPLDGFDWHPVSLALSMMQPAEAPA